MPGAVVARDERVTLRTFEREDIPFLQRAHANPEIRYQMGKPLKNRAELESWTDDATDRFVVCLDDEAASPGDADDAHVTPIGVVTVEDADWRRPELTYWLVPERHGDGYGTEAVSLAIDYTFRTYAHPAVGACAYESNDASRGLLESLGFVEEGCTRMGFFADGGYVDTVQYGLLRSEWDAANE
ncbi:protein acetyltransferase [Haloprofundus marisrubri]|uniref:Protein acetyltransferase n=1 Tax=Haloprofundus marisrubri TaxID=1514971 RepID=A0A0W1R7H9_9EURY|nr:GNAT family protein [Haloprofundus marisrubri]KTG09336.1 protein acetyltransferase [Haloprofundus marisrubri]